MSKKKTAKIATTKGTKTLGQLPQKDTMLRECKNCDSLDIRTIKTIAELSNSSCKGKSKYDKLESLNEDTLKTLYLAFVNKEHDKSGTYFEYRALAHYLKHDFASFEKEERESLDHIERHKNLTYGSGGQKNFDSVAYYNDKTIDVIECKDRKKPVDVKDLSGYIELIRKVDELRGSRFYDVLHFYFVSSSGFTDRALASARDTGGDGGRWTWDKKLLRRKNYIDIHLIAEIDGELKQVYPTQ